MPKRIAGELKVSHEAREMIALAMEGMGGLDQLIKTANRSDSSRMTFYTQIYAKLIPLQLNAQSTLAVSVNAAGEEAKQKLQSAFLALFESAREDRRAALDARRAIDDGGPSSIDAGTFSLHTMARDFEQVTYTRIDEPATVDASPSTRDADTSTVDARPAPRVDETNSNPNLEMDGSPLRRGPRRDDSTPAHEKPRSYPNPVSEPSTTSKYYDWMNGAGGARARWDNNGGMP